jgi:hypothetical protein
MSTGLKALIGAGAVAIVAVVGFLVLGGDDDADPNSPVGTVRALYDAFERKDCEAMVDLMSEELWSDGGTATRNDTLAECESDATEDEGFAMEGVDLDFSLESESGDAAVVSMKASFMGDSFTSTVDLVREAGRWKVDSFAESPGGSGSSDSSDVGDAEEPGS